MIQGQIITVPFEKKELARSLQIKFDRTERKWYIPTELEAQTEDILKQLNDTSIIEPHIDSSEVSTHSNIERISSIITHIQVNNWNEILENRNTLECALGIQKFGLPETTEQRTTLLQILGSRRDGQYPITYDGMLILSKEFEEAYSPEYVTELVQNCITGERPYQEEIHQSQLSEEEKALLFLVLPV